MAGRSTVALKAEQLGLGLDDAVLGDIVERLKDLEHRGFHFEVADGSLELLMRSATGWKQPFFSLESHRVITELREDGAFVTEATVKVIVGDDRVLATAEGNGPVNALDAALRKAIGPVYPELAHMHLTDFKVRVLDTSHGTAAVTRVLIDTTDGDRTWTTIGVSENVIEASWAALEDSIVFGLLHAGAGSAPAAARRGRDPAAPCSAPGHRPGTALVVAAAAEPLVPAATGGVAGPTRRPGGASARPAPTWATGSSWPAAGRTDWWSHRTTIARTPWSGASGAGPGGPPSFGRAPVDPRHGMGLHLVGLPGRRRPAELVAWRDGSVPRRRRGLLGAASHRRCRPAGDPAVDPGSGP